MSNMTADSMRKCEHEHEHESMSAWCVHVLLLVCDVHMHVHVLCCAVYIAFFTAVQLTAISARLCVRYDEDTIVMHTRESGECKACICAASGLGRNMHMDRVTHLHADG